MNWNPISAVASVIGGAFEKREERKINEKTLDAKLTMKRNDNSTEVAFNEQDWEILSKRNENNTWKDEYITISMLVPVNVVFLSVFIGVLFAEPDIIAASKQAVDAMKELVPNYEYLLGLVVMAGLSIKAIKR